MFKADKVRPGNGKVKEKGKGTRKDTCQGDLR